MSNQVMSIEVGSHYFKVLNPTPRVIPTIMQFCKRYTLYSWVKEHGRGRPVYKASKVFATRTRNNREFRFHIGQYKDFIECLERDYIISSMYTVEYMGLYEPTTIEVDMRDGWVLRDYQEPVHRFIMEDAVDDNLSRLVAMATGTGKGLVSLSAIAALKTRTLIVVLPTYCLKWAKEIEQILTVDSNDILIIQGSKHLKRLIDQGTSDVVEAKFIIVSLRTIQNWFKAYELDPDSMDQEGYGCVPEDLCRILGIGTMILDETHQHLHAIYKLLAYTHVPKVIALSAMMFFS